MKRFLYTLLFIKAQFAAQIALAHEKWFIETVPAIPKPLLFSRWDTVNSSFVLAALFGILAAILIHFAVRPHRWARRMRSFFARYKAWVPSVLRTATGLLFVVATFSKFLFSPDLVSEKLPSAVAPVFLALQLLTGLMLVVGIFPRVASLIGFALYIVMLGAFNTLTVLGYISFVGIFAYLFIMGDPALPRTRGAKPFNLFPWLNLANAKPFAQSFLRISAGIGFFLIAAIYKLWKPYYALEFLRMHSVNFMPSLGFVDFSDEMFVLAAGLTEAAVGILLILGILPRFIGGFLILAFTLTLSIFGLYELVGHLPLYAIAFALLIQGGGERFSSEEVRVSRSGGESK